MSEHGPVKIRPRWLRAEAVREHMLALCKRELVTLHENSERHAAELKDKHKREAAELYERHKDGTRVAEFLRASEELDRRFDAEWDRHYQANEAAEGSIYEKYDKWVGID